LVGSKITNGSKSKGKMHMNCGNYPVQVNTIFFRRKKERKGDIKEGLFPYRI
jgi:hypothetical protein